MSEELLNCPVCEYPSLCTSGTIKGTETIITQVKCLRCKEFVILYSTASDVSSYLITDENRMLASSYISEFTNDNYVIDLDELKRLAIVEKPPVDERASKLLLYIAKKYPDIGSGPSYDDIDSVFNKGMSLDATDFSNPIFSFTHQMMSLSWLQHRKELAYLIHEYHVAEKNYLRIGSNNELVITPKGWSRIDELKTKIIESNIGFIAMKYNSKLIKYSKDWFEKAITESGYEAKVMYSHKHLKLIDNEMIALIRRSKFLVCDMTENSRGAYYEAGFAHGLGIPVIFICESKYFHEEDNELGSESKGVHFDTNHYPYIEWEWDKGEELSNDLKNWIEATIGRGAISQS